MDCKSVDVTKDRSATKPVRMQGEHIVLATGSVERGLPSMPFGGRVISSTQALSPDSTPKKLVVVGTIHAHPTLGEAVQEAALRALGHALHI